MEEEGGFEYRWVYGLDKLSVKVTSEGTNWWGQNVKQDILKDYTHQDRMGSTTNLTDRFGRVVGRADYNEWGQITYKEALDITSSYRRIYPQLSYTGHDWDDVLGMYYAKARFYDADTKRFVAIDPVKGSVTDPLSLVPYIYCVDNPLRWVDPLGQECIAIYAGEAYPLVEVLGPAGLAGLASGGIAVIAVGVVVGIIIIVIDEKVAYFSNNNVWQVRKAEAQRNGVAQTSYYDFTKIEQEEQKLLRKTPTTAKQNVTQLAQYEQSLLRQTQTPTTAKQDVTKLAQNEQQLLRQAQTLTTTTQDVTQEAQYEQQLLHKTPAYEETTPAYVNFPPSHDPLSSGARGYMTQVGCEGQEETEGKKEEKEKETDRTINPDGLTPEEQDAINDILSGTKDSDKTKGKTDQRTKSGDYEDALSDFDKIPLSEKKDIDTQYGKGRTGKLSNGKSVTVRPGSSEGSPTLQIPEGASRQIEIRYK